MTTSLIRRAISVLSIKCPIPRKYSSKSINYLDRAVHRTYTIAKEASIEMAEKMLPQIFKFVDQNVSSYKNLLKEAVAIPSVSCDAKYRPDCVRMVEWMQEKLKEVGASTQLRDVGFQTIDGKEVKLPPVLVGVLGNVSKIIHYLFLSLQYALHST